MKKSEVMDMDKHEVMVKISEDVSIILNIPSELSGEEFRSYDVLCMSIDGFVKSQLTRLPKHKKTVKPVLDKKKKKKNTSNRLTPEQRVQFKKMYLGGVSLMEIVAKLNLQKDTAKALCWRVRNNDFPNWWNSIQ
jgi:hypothetical protein